MKPALVLSVAAVGLAAAVIAFPRVKRLGPYEGLVTTWGSAGTEDGHFRYPEDIAVAPDGRLFITDAVNANVQVFSPEGVFLSAFGGQGKEQGELSKPEGVALDPDGNCFVGDYLSGFIHKFDPSGRPIQRFSGFGPKPGQTAESEFMDISPDRTRLYIAEAGNHRVSVFRVADGEFLFAFGGFGSGPGELNRPEAAKCAPNGDVYVTDLANHRVQVFDSEGEYKLGWGTEGGADGQFRKPAGLVVDARGHVFVTEIGNGRMQCFTADGQHLETFDAAEVGGLKNPHGVAITAAGDLYVCDSGNFRIVQYQLREHRH